LSILPERHHLQAGIRAETVLQMQLEVVCEKLKRSIRCRETVGLGSVGNNIIHMTTDQISYYLETNQQHNQLSTRELSYSAM